MKILIETYKKTGDLHHAYLITGERNSTVSNLICFLEEEVEIKKNGNPDFWHGEFDTLSIDEGRVLKEMQEKKAFAGGKKIFIISANSITREAQNSLLKVFEEPTPETHFFLIMPLSHGLLPTLLSRLFLIKMEAAESAKKEAKEFLSAEKAGRLKIVKEMTDAISDEKMTKADVIAFLHDVEVLLYKKNGKLPMKPGEAEIFHELLSVKGYLNDRAPSVKMLLEHLALLIPNA